MKNHISILSTKKLKEKLTRQALQAGFTIMHYDFITVSFTGSLDSLNETLIFTSGNAVSVFAKYKVDKNTSFHKYKVYCLEGETFNALKDIDGIEIISSARNALSLAKKIIADEQVRELSFICGHQRRDELPDMLRQHNIHVHEVKVYETHHTGQPVKHDYRAVLFFSPSAAESFFQTNILAPGIPCFCIGATTAATVNGYTDNPVVIAEEPSQESVLDALKRFFKIDQKENNANERHIDSS